ncbi:hypothetical protein CRM22_007517 [Opisthorchis felineus]|uniref:Secreted protein n=1 Tax=Opisthorchis felineus TaxID=147828 RepID=A0A4V3SDX1_OPIFE|nr:hypothetical protein CRM22_007517 [Opisthorchis felineus]
MLLSLMMMMMIRISKMECVVVWCCVNVSGTKMHGSAECIRNERYEIGALSFTALYGIKRWNLFRPVIELGVRSVFKTEVISEDKHEVSPLGGAFPGDVLLAVVWSAVID